MPMDKIHICDLLLRCIVGINPEERVKKQDVLINITLGVDTKKAGKTDAIEDTLDYKKLKVQIVEMVEASSFYLIEKMAQKIADICLSHGKVYEATVRVDKPSALRFAKTVAVEIQRKRGDAPSG